MNKPIFGKYNIELWNKLFLKTDNCSNIVKYYSKWTIVDHLTINNSLTTSEQILNDIYYKYKENIHGKIITWVIQILN
jgi:hypothetical protein